MKVTALWQNWPGAPGYSNFYSFSAGDGNVPDIRAFFEAIKAYIPNGVVVQVLNEGDYISDATGTINGSWTTSAVAAVTGTGSGAYAGNAGAVVHWISDGIVAGRRPRGRTFLVPLANVHDTSGSIATSVLSTIEAAAQALITSAAGDLFVWSRPFEGSGSKPPRDGSSHAIVGARVPDLSASLRSRRT